jgi:peptidoglycan/LPS O-acetylase OafA/YrhL
MGKDNGFSGSRFYRPELDVLRFFAFSCVFLAHSWLGDSTIARTLQLAAQVGLPLFFLLSSFLITELLERECVRAGTIHLRSFFVRRILRIWPLYLTFIVGTYLFWHNTVLATEPITRGRFISYLVMVANWYAVVKRNIGLSPISPLWSISVEEQFYLLWAFLYKPGGKTLATIASMLTFPVAMIAIFYVTRQPGATDVELWPNSFVLFIFFGAGAIIALYKHRLPRPSCCAIRLASFSGSLLIALLGVVLFKPVGTVSFAQSVGRYGCMLIAAAGLLLSAYGSSNAGRSRLLVYLGKISFGLYVFHMLTIEWADELTLRVLKLVHHGGALITLVLSAVLTVSLAALSYRFLESPFLRLKDRFAVVKTRTI